MRFKRQSHWTIVVSIALLLILGVGPLLHRSSADKLPNRRVELINPQGGQQTSYEFSFDVLSASPVGSIRFQFCSDTPLLDQTCTAPNGLDTSGALLSGQTGEINFSIGGGTDVNDIVLTRTAQVTTPGTVTYKFSNIQNPTDEGSYYVRIQTYVSTDASGSYTDGGGLAFAINSPISISTKVPPYLLLCGGLEISNFDCSSATGDYINFGELSSQTTKSATTSLVLATNASSGYNVYADGTTMTTGNSVIPALASSDVSRPGTSQFGINLVANTTPAVGNNVQGPGSGTVAAAYAVADHYRFVSGELISSSPGVSDYRKYTISYIANIARTQPPGIYVTTITYVAVASF